MTIRTRNCLDMAKHIIASHGISGRLAGGYRVFKKTALIEKRFKDTTVNLDYTERAVFLISDHHCDMENKYLYLPGCYSGGSWVCLGYFMGVSRIHQDYFKSVSI